MAFVPRHPISERSEHLARHACERLPELQFAVTLFDERKQSITEALTASLSIQFRPDSDFGSGAMFWYDHGTPVPMRSGGPFLSKLDVLQTCNRVWPKESGEPPRSPKDGLRNSTNGNSHVRLRWRAPLSDSKMSNEFEQHETAYQRLQQIRLDWCVSNPDLPTRDCAGEYLLDAFELQSIPDFYIRLGTTINGENGYFGGCLDALEDCLCGGFGVVPPFTLRIKNSEQLEHGFRDDAVNYWIASSKTDNDDIDASKAQSYNGGSDLNYLADLLKILKSKGVTVILD